MAVGACIQAANAVFSKVQNGYDVETNAFGQCFDTEDMIEGTTAFFEKRKAIFTGK